MGNDMENSFNKIEKSFAIYVYHIVNMIIPTEITTPPVTFLAAVTNVTSNVTNFSYYLIN